jgi:hypothetical protein
MQDNDNILENTRHQHNQRDIQRKARAGALLAHRPNLIRIRRDGRSHDEQRRHVRDGPLDESHRPTVPQTNKLSALTRSLACISEREDVRFNILLAQREVAPGGEVLEVRVLGCWHCPNMDDLIATGYVVRA